MAKSGEKLRQNSKGVWEKRVKLCGKKLLLAMPQFATLEDKPQAERREAILLVLAAQLSATDTPFKLARIGLRKVARASELLTADVKFTLDDACVLIRDVLGGWRPKGDSVCPTFEEVFKRWQSNELARMYPDKVKWRGESTIYQAGRYFENYSKPLIGSLPVDQINLKLADLVKQSVAHMLESDSRRQALQHVKQVLDICVKLGYIPSTPLPKGWMPRRASQDERRRLQFLFASEEGYLCAGFSPEQQAQIRKGVNASLLQPVVDFEWRMLWAFISRQGRRKVETTLIELGQITWRRGRAIIQLRANQTKGSKAHAWVLDEPSTRALRIFIALRRRGALPSDRLFVTPEGKPINPESIDLPALLREHLWAVGVRRPELHTTIPGESRQIVVHDLRATHVTVKAACGLSDNEIMKTTGQKRTETVHQYKRRADVAAMFDEGDFVPFDRALPELCAPGTFELPELLDDAAPSEDDLPTWVLEASRSQPAVLPARLVPAVLVPAALPANASQSTGQRLASDLQNPREMGVKTYSIVKQGQPTQVLDIAENSAVTQVVATPWQPMADPSGHAMAALQAQLDALRAVVVGGLAAEVATQVAAQLQAAGVHKQAKRARKARK